ncbi:hypothetical protein ACHQM5_022747 [Ranunculus cassubicifolius]
MLEDIRLYMMERIMKRKASINSRIGELGPRIRARIDKGKEDSRNWLSTHNGSNKFEVKHVRGKHSYIVDMNLKVCSCGLWSLSGIPCTHAIAAIYHLRDQPENYVSDWYHRNKMEMAYFHGLEPINGEPLWVKHGGIPLKPPRQRRLPGRPKKARRKEFHEEKSTRVSRVGRVMHCSKCGQPGHMKSTCTNEEVPIELQPPRARRNTPRVQASGSSINTESVEGSVGPRNVPNQPQPPKTRRNTTRTEASGSKTTQESAQASVEPSSVPRPPRTRKNTSSQANVEPINGVSTQASATTVHEDGNTIDNVQPPIPRKAPRRYKRPNGIGILFDEETGQHLMKMPGGTGKTKWVDVRKVINPPKKRKTAAPATNPSSSRIVPPPQPAAQSTNSS